MLVLLAVTSAIVVVSGRYIRTDPPPLAAPVHPLLPDLTMGPIQDVYGGLAEVTRDPVVRVEATIVDKGAGPFLTSSRRDVPWSNSWTVYQRIMEADGGYTERATKADLIFAGAPHSHWHIQNMESHRLEDKATGKVLSEVVKQAFCPFDTDLYFGSLPGAPPNPFYMESGCEGPAWVTELTMGVSVGWGDKYPWHMIEQNIPIKGIPDGTYRIVETADPFDWFEESDESNNSTWIDIAIKTEAGIPVVTVVGRAP